jgi:hypothetical protein
MKGRLLLCNEYGSIHRPEVDAFGFFLALTVLTGKLFIHGVSSDQTGWRIRKCLDFSE